MVVHTLNHKEHLLAWKMENDEITYQIIGCAMKIHNNLGNGFHELIYQRCLAIEFKEVGLHFEREKPKKILYDNSIVGERRADFIIEERILVEIKALVDLQYVHLTQAKNYSKAYNLPLGLLINFGARSLQYKKIFRQ